MELANVLFDSHIEYHHKLKWIEPENKVTVVKDMDRADIYKIVYDAARGLKILHRLGIAHRDIKRFNVFLKANGDRVIRAFLADFGDSKHNFTLRTRTAGTPPYKAPEIIASSTNLPTSDPSEDIYSFGLFLVEVFTGIISNGFSTLEQQCG